MQYTVPNYYEKFKCIASKCPDTCCAGWKIMIDDASLEKYQKVKGGMGNRLQNSIYMKEKCFEQYEGRCAFLNEKNLCDIYEECGKEMLCETCQTYPRHIEEFENLREMSLALSCPEAARLIFSEEDRIEFLTTEDETEEEYEEFDYFLFTTLQDTRELMMRFIQDRGMNYRIRMSMVLALAHDMQLRLKKGAVYEVDGLLERYGKVDAQVRFAKKLEPYCNRRNDAQKYRLELFSVIEEFEVLNPKWTALLKQAKTILTKEKEKLHIQGQQEMSLWWEQLMTYFVFVYFCGAVYDEDALGKIKLAVASTIFILELNKVYDDITKVAHMFSRELEHSEKNMKLFEHHLLHNPVCSFEKMLVCIMN